MQVSNGQITGMGTNTASQTAKPTVEETEQNVFKSATDSVQLSSLTLAPHTNCSCSECMPVAANEEARIWGDPHINDADGGKYDVQDVGNFNVLKDKDVSLIAKTEGKAGKSTFITEAGLSVGDNQVHILADGTTTITNKAGSTTELKDGDTIMLDDNNVIKREDKNITVTTQEYRMDFETGIPNKGPVASLRGKQHIDINIKSKEGGVMLDGQAPTGLLGETFDADTKKQKAPKQKINEYRTDSLFPDASTSAQESSAAAAAKETYDEDCVCEPVAPGEYAKVYGDPHFRGADGDKYDVHAKGVHSILSDHGVEFNAKTEGKKNGAGYHTEVGLVLRDKSVMIKADGTVSIGAQDGSNPVELADGKTMMLDDYNAIKREGKNVTLISQEYKMVFSTQNTAKNPKAPKGIKFINTEIWSKEGGVMQDRTAPSGLLGETFDADTKKQKAPKNPIGEYKRDTLFSLSTPSTTSVPAPIATTKPVPAPAPTATTKPAPAPAPTATTKPAPAQAPTAYTPTNFEQWMQSTFMQFLMQLLSKWAS